jgi:glycosyltransferase involved in cell wall biosynthesis
MCSQGESVHLICQENHPEKYDFISTSYLYRLDGTIQTLIEREVPFKGNCILHKPQLDELLPVYVRDHYEEFDRVVPMIELSTDEIEAYLERNVEILIKIIEKYSLSILHANHAVLMSVVAHRVGKFKGIPYTVMPHGSAIEYAVKKDKRFYDYALHSFDQAKNIFVIGPEIQQRVLKIFSSLPYLKDRMIQLNLGADTKLFKPIDRVDRGKNILHLTQVLTGIQRGKNPQQSKELLESNIYGRSKENAKRIISNCSNYDNKLPDQNLEEKLAKINWENDRIILFLGRLIESKGLQSIIAALPEILARETSARLLVVGHGPQREVMELFVAALQEGRIDLIANLVEWGSALETLNGNPYFSLQQYYTSLSKLDQLDTYIHNARQFIKADSVIFTGYLTHSELRYLFPCCDIALFPSIVAEAGPLVFLEALASGCFPLGTYFAGMAASIDSVAHYLGPTDTQVMRISRNQTGLVADIAEKAVEALKICDKYKNILSGSFKNL